MQTFISVSNSQNGPWSSSISIMWEFVKHADSWAHPKNLYMVQAQQWFSCMLKFENHWSITLNIVSSILTYDDRSSDHFRDKGKIQFWCQNASRVTTLLISFYNWNLCYCILFTNWLFRQMQVFLLKFKHTHTSSSVYWTK